MRRRRPMSLRSPRARVMRAAEVAFACAVPPATVANAAPKSLRLGVPFALRALAEVAITLAITLH
jgi:hypothetical protein